MSGAILVGSKGGFFFPPSLPEIIGPPTLVSVHREICSVSCSTKSKILQFVRNEFDLWYSLRDSTDY